MTKKAKKKRQKLADRIAEVLKKRPDKTKGGLAEKMGVYESRVSELISGKWRAKWYMVPAMAEYLEMDEPGVIQLLLMEDGLTDTISPGDIVAAPGQTPQPDAPAARTREGDIMDDWVADMALQLLKMLPPDRAKSVMIEAVAEIAGHKKRKGTAARPPKKARTSYRSA